MLISVLIGHEGSHVLSAEIPKEPSLPAPGGNFAHRFRHTQHWHRRRDRAHPNLLADRLDLHKYTCGNTQCTSSQSMSMRRIQRRGREAPSATSHQQHASPVPPGLLLAPARTACPVWADRRSLTLHPDGHLGDSPAMAMTNRGAGDGCVQGFVPTHVSPPLAEHQGQRLLDGLVRVPSVL